MRTSITKKYWPLLCALVLGLAHEAQAAPVPVAVTGYTADVVADGTGTAASRTTLDFDGASYALMTVGYTNPAGTAATSGLPVSGLINSATTSGLSFQLASYTANNSLRIATTAGTGALTLTTPRAVGDVYVLASSGSGVSTMVVTLTFTDGTTQAFPATTVADWYGGANPAMIGLGRVSVADNTITNNTTDPRLYEFRFSLATANIGKLVQSVGFSKTSTTGVLNVMGISVNPLCTGAPTPGTATATATNTCAAANIVVSLTGASTDGGIAYQWQSSTNGGTTYTDIAGATSATYTVAGQSVNTLYRARLTCTSASLSATSSAVTISTTPPTYATLPVIESFESTWLDVCNTRDVPTVSWRNSPATGNSSWRRDDDATAAAWTSPTLGGYAPAGSQGTHSARFHSYTAGAAAVGTMDLSVDLSPAGNKRLSFDYLNTAGNDSLLVYLSTNGGTTFGAPVLRLGLSGTVAQGWAAQVVNMTSASASSATSVIRFRTKVTTTFTSDIGLDNIRLEVASGCLSPTSLAAAVTQNGATLSWGSAGTGTYTVVYGLAGFNPATAGTTVSGITGTSTTISGLTGGTGYQFYVTQVCSSTSSSSQTGPFSFTTSIANDDCAGAINVPIQYGTTCITQVTADNTLATASANVPAPGCANYVGGDVWFQMTVPASGTVTVQTLPATAGSPITDTGLAIYSGTCANLTLIECDDDDSPNGLFSLITLNGRTPGEVLYIRAWEYGNDTQGLIAVCALAPSNCAAPTTAVATNLANTTATLSWTAPTTAPAAGNTYELEYGPQGFTQGNGTAITGINATTTTSYNLTGLTANTPYCYYVRQNCGTTNGASAYVGPICFTTLLTAPGNDEPCGAFAVTSTSQTGSTVGATTTTTPTSLALALPTCSGATQPKDVWYTFTPTTTSATFTFTGTNVGSVRVFSLNGTCSAGTYTQVGCVGATSATTGLTTAAFTGLTAGTRYYLSIANFSTTAATGAFTVLGTVLGNRAQAETNALVVFPNPSNTGQLSLRLSAATAGSATLLNALGQVVLTKNLTAGTAEHSLSTRGLAAGVYTLRVQQGSDLLTRKVVLE